MTDFARWITAELERRGWSQIELVNRSGMTRGAISNFASGKRIPNAASCLKIAEALSLPHETVLVAAGNMDNRPADTPATNEIMQIAKRMNDEEQALVRDFARWIYERNRS